MSKVVLYICNEHPFYLRMAVTSIGMLRKHNPTVPVRLYLIEDGKKDTVSRPNMLETGLSPDEAKKACEGLNVDVRVKPRADLPGEEGYFYAQRHVLHEVPEESVLYLDGDTFVFGDVEGLFEAHKTDVAACENEWVWGFGFRPDFLPLKPFNSGVMVWHNGWFQKWAAQLPALMRELYDGDSPLSKWLWEKDNKCLGREEFSVSLFTARNDLSYGYLSKKECWLNKQPQDYLRAGDSLIFHSYSNHWRDVYGRVFGAKKKVTSYVRKK